MANIKKGDLVQVINGRKQEKGGDRGKQGKVLEILVADLLGAFELLLPVVGLDVREDLLEIGRASCRERVSIDV